MGLELAVAVGRQTMILPWQRHCLLARGAKWHDLSLALQLAAGLGRQGMILLLPRGAKVAAYLGTGLGCWLGAPRYDRLRAPRYDLTLALALAAALGRQGLILPWRWPCLLPQGAQDMILPTHWTGLLPRGAKV